MEYLGGILGLIVVAVVGMVGKALVDRWKDARERIRTQGAIIETMLAALESWLGLKQLRIRGAPDDEAERRSFIHTGTSVTQAMSALDVLEHEVPENDRYRASLDALDAATKSVRDVFRRIDSLKDPSEFQDLVGSMWPAIARCRVALDALTRRR